jgi:hypothetical protein
VGEADVRRGGSFGVTIRAVRKQQAVVFACLALLSAEALTQARGQAQPPGSREVCQPFEGRCIVIQPPSILRPPPPGWQPPRTRDGKPDFTGVYAGAGFNHQTGRNDTDTPIIRGFDAKAMAPLKPGGEKILFRPFTGDLKIDDPIALCLPYGFTSQIFSPYAQQWVQAPNHLVIKHEFWNNFSRIISLDGRPHPPDLEPTWGGHSVGRWEGDELVIDTVGLKEWWLDNPHPKGSLWHSDAAHITERVKWMGPNLVSYQVTVDDPKIWTTPWTEQFHMVLHPTWELLEFVCNENDRCSGGKCTQSDAQKQ